MRCRGSCARASPWLGSRRRGIRLTCLDRVWGGCVGPLHSRASLPAVFAKRVQGPFPPPKKAQATKEMEAEHLREGEVRTSQEEGEEGTNRRDACHQIKFVCNHQAFCVRTQKAFRVFRAGRGPARALRPPYQAVFLRVPLRAPAEGGVEGGGSPHPCLGAWAAQPLPGGCLAVCPVPHVVWEGQWSPLVGLGPKNEIFINFLTN